MIIIIVMGIPVDVISTLDFPRGKKGCAEHENNLSVLGQQSKKC